MHILFQFPCPVFVRFLAPHHQQSGPSRFLSYSVVDFKGNKSAARSPGALRSSYSAQYQYQAQLGSQTQSPHIFGTRHERQAGSAVPAVKASSAADGAELPRGQRGVARGKWAAAWWPSAMTHRAGFHEHATNHLKSATCQRGEPP